jgi:hypothetical protein
VDGELRRQVASRAIENATCLDYVAPAFVVVQSSGKRRVVVDFDKLNKETLRSAFRYETLKSLCKAPGEERRLGNFLWLGGRVSCHPFPSTRTTGSTFTFSIGGEVFPFAALPFGWTR